MVKKLYMKDNYKKEFEAEVRKEGKGWVRLSKTVFHPKSGGQPSDQGWLKWNGKKSRVKKVKKDGGKLRHHLGGEVPKEGQKVRGKLDWDRRYQIMKYHTAQHVISRVVLNLYGGTTAGNNIYLDYARVDFKPVNFCDEDLERIEEKTNEVLRKGLPVRIETMERENLKEEMEKNRCNLDLLPPNIKKLRVIKIGDFDICPCAGTHVKNTKEVGKIRITKNERKGKDTERIYYKIG